MVLSFHDFCFAFSLQAGVVATSTVGFTLMFITFMLNLYAPNSMEENMQICQYVLLYVYLLVMMTAFGMAFLASFWEKSKVTRISAIILIFGTIFYFVLSVISFIRAENLMAYVCPEMRCPDHHWLQDARWRTVYAEMESEDVPNKAPMRHLRHEHSSPNLEEILMSRDIENLGWTETYYLNDTVKVEHATTAITRKPSTTKREDVLSLMFVSFLYTLLFMGYYVYTIITLFAFAKHLDNKESGT